MSVTWPKVSNPPRQTDPHFYEIAENIAIYMDEDQDHFHKFGTNLLPESMRVLVIKKQKKGDTERCRELFNEWLRVTTNPKWEQVIEALQKSELKGPAGCLTEALNSSETPQGGKESRKRKADFENVDETDHYERESKKHKHDLEIDGKALKQMYNDKFADGVITEEKQMNNLKRPQLKVLLQTVNANEFYAVMLQLNKDSGVSKYTVKNHNHPEESYYYVGKWGNKEIPVAIIQTEMGSDDAHGSYNETKKALECLPNLKYIFSVGVCGGIKGKVELGEVVVSKVLQDYSCVKFKDHKMIIRSPGYSFTENDFYHFLSRAANKPDNTECGQVLSADWLVADDEILRKLSEAFPEAIAVEMEGHGIARARKEFKNREVEYLIVKGVSDLADKNKADDWQPRAAINAAEALYKVMAAKFDSFDNGDDCSISTSATEKVQKTEQGRNAQDESDLQSTDEVEKAKVPSVKAQAKQRKMKSKRRQGYGKSPNK